jgi:hypothetical protein
MSKNPLFSEEEILEMQWQNNEREQEKWEERQKYIDQQTLLLNTFGLLAHAAKGFPAAARQVGIQPKVYRCVKNHFYEPSKSKPLYGLKIRIAPGRIILHRNRIVPIGYVDFGELHVSEQGDLYVVHRHRVDGYGAIVVPFLFEYAERLFKASHSDVSDNIFCREMMGLCYRDVHKGEVYTTEEIKENIRNHLKKLLQAK